MKVNGIDVLLDTCWYLKNGMVVIIARDRPDGDGVIGYIHINSLGNPGFMSWYGNGECVAGGDEYALDLPVKWSKWVDFGKWNTL